MRSPLPDRDFVPAARLHLPVDGSWQTVAAFLLDRTHDATGVQHRLDHGGIVFSDGTVVHPDTPYCPGDSVFLYRDLPEEVPVPGEIEIVYQDRNIVVIDKPHFLATMPRGQHVVETAVIRLRRLLRNPDLVPAHRLDRLTAGLLMFTARPEVRAVYQGLFARREVSKIYLARAAVRDDVTVPRVVRSRIVKRRGVRQALEVPGPVNAVTRIELLRREGAAGLYRLVPVTGRTHQLRVHMAGLGLPIEGDPLYPTRREVAADDFSAPLQLLATELSFTDPVTGEAHHFHSRRSLAQTTAGSQIPQSSAR